MADKLTVTAYLFPRMWRDYLRPHWLKILLALLFLIVEGSTLGLLSWMLKPLFDKVFVGGDTSAMWWVGGVIFALFLIRAATYVVNRSLMTSVSLAVSTRMQTDLLRHIMTLDGSFFQKNPPGAMIERVQGDSIAVQGVWATFIAGAGRDVVSLVSLFAVALAVDPEWTLAALVGAPLLILPMLVVQRYIRRKMRQNRVNAGQRATRLDEVLHGIRAVRLYRMEDYQTATFRRIVGDIQRSETKVSAVGALVPALIDIVTGLGFLGVLALGGAQVTSGERTVGGFVLRGGRVHGVSLAGCGRLGLDETRQRADSRRAGAATGAARCRHRAARDAPPRGAPHRPGHRRAGAHGHGRRPPAPGPHPRHRWRSRHPARRTQPDRRGRLGRHRLPVGERQRAPQPLRAGQEPGLIDRR